MAACSAAPSAGPAAGSIPQPEVTGLPVAAATDRVDLAVPSFSDPTSITNPLFPVEPGGSAVLLGKVDDEPFRAEVTVLPDPHLITWEGRTIKTVVSQYVAYLDGQLHEVALDHYAQDDSGNVWYFGEDVFNYDSGVVADTEGTWLAGRDGPAAMIMPAEPRVGEVYRPENIPGFVFEEVTVRAVDQTVDGPRGSVDGAILVDELHLEGDHETKTFAPGYGEFFTGADGEVEALAVGSPTDRAQGTAPTVFGDLLVGTQTILDTTRAANWALASPALADVRDAWATYRRASPPPLLVDEVESTLEDLATAVTGQDETDAANAAADVRLAILDLALLYDSPTSVDVLRVLLAATRLVLDATAGDAPQLASDLAAVAWTRDRFAHRFPSAQVSELDELLGTVRVAAVSGNVRDAQEALTNLQRAAESLAAEHANDAAEGAPSGP